MLVSPRFQRSSDSLLAAPLPKRAYKSPRNQDPGGVLIARALGMAMIFSSEESRLPNRPALTAAFCGHGTRLKPARNHLLVCRVFITGSAATQQGSRRRELAKRILPTGIQR